MAESAVVTQDERVAAWVAMILLAGSFVLFLLMLPAVVHNQARFSPWIYVPGVLSFFVAVWKKADAVVNLAILWLSVFFIIDLIYGVSFFAG
jgi:hypothetical protein